MSTGQRDCAVVKWVAYFCLAVSVYFLVVVVPGYPGHALALRWYGTWMRLYGDVGGGATRLFDHSAWNSLTCISEYGRPLPLGTMAQGKYPKSQASNRQLGLGFSIGRFGISDNPSNAFESDVLFLRIPYWFLALCILPWPIRYFRRKRLLAWRLRSGLCTHCGYDKRFVVGVCPECGNVNEHASWRLREVKNKVAAQQLESMEREL